MVQTVQQQAITNYGFLMNMSVSIQHSCFEETTLCYISIYAQYMTPAVTTHYSKSPSTILDCSDLFYHATGNDLGAGMKGKMTKALAIGNLIH